MKSRFDVQQLLSPGFSKNIQNNAQVIPPPALPVNIFEINVEEYLANNVMETPTPFRPLDDNLLNAKLMRQALGLKVNNTRSTTSSTSSNNNNFRSNPSYQFAYDTNRKPLSTNPSSINTTSTTKFGFSKH